MQRFRERGRASLGLDLDPDRPGYKHIVLHPRPGGGLTRAAVELQSMYGGIRSAWTCADGRFGWQIVVPANTTATVFLPAKDESQVTESGRPWKNTNGAAFSHMENGCAVFCLMAGVYFFLSPMD